MIGWAGARETLVRRREQVLYVVVGGWNTLSATAPSHSSTTSCTTPPAWPG